MFVPFCALSEVELNINSRLKDVLALLVSYVEISLVPEEE